MVAQKVYTYEDFHKFVERAEASFEWVNGQIIALHSGEQVEESLVDYVLSDAFDRNYLPDFPMPTQKHDDIVSNLHGLLFILLRHSNFRVYSQATFVRGNEMNKSRQPDITVVKKEEQMRGKWHEVLNPVVVMEVLSKATQKVDQLEKLEEYQNMSSVLEYVMIAQNQARVVVYRRLSQNKWEEEIYTGLEHHLAIASLMIELPLQDIYENVAFDPA